MHASIGLVSCIHRNRMRQIWGLNEFIHLSSFSALSSAAICGFPFLLNVVTIHFMMMILPCNATGFNVPSHENNSRENAFFFSGSGLSFFSWSYIYIMYKFWVSSFFFLSFSRLILDSKLIFDKLCFRSTFISSMPPYSLPPLYNPMLSCIYLLVFIALARRSSIPMRIYIYIYVTCI